MSRKHNQGKLTCQRSSSRARDRTPVSPPNTCPLDHTVPHLLRVRTSTSCEYVMLGTTLLHGWFYSCQWDYSCSDMLFRVNEGPLALWDSHPLSNGSFTTVCTSCLWVKVLHPFLSLCAEGSFASPLTPCLKITSGSSARTQLCAAFFFLPYLRLLWL